MQRRATYTVTEWMQFGTATAAGWKMRLLHAKAEGMNGLGGAKPEWSSEERWKADRLTGRGEVTESIGMHSECAWRRCLVAC